MGWPRRAARLPSDSMLPHAHGRRASDPSLPKSTAVCLRGAAVEGPLPVLPGLSLQARDAFCAFCGLASAREGLRPDQLQRSRRLVMPIAGEVNGRSHARATGRRCDRAVPCRPTRSLAVEIARSPTDPPHSPPPTPLGAGASTMRSVKNRAVSYLRPPGQPEPGTSRRARRCAGEQ